MGKADYLKEGDFNRICDRTGFKVKASDTRREWNNLIVRKESYEPRQPQDLYRTRADKQAVPDPRSESEDSFVAPGDVEASDL